MKRLIVAISCILGVLVVLDEYFSKSNWVVLKSNEVVFLLLLILIISPLSSISIFLLSLKSILPFFAIIIWVLFLFDSSFKSILSYELSSFFFSIKIVRPLTVSINFFGLIKFGKKSKFEFLIKDLYLSWV